MKKLLSIILATTIIAGTAQACTAFLKGDYMSGMNRVCIYDHLGDDYIVTIKAHQICKLSVKAPH